MKRQREDYEHSVDSLKTLERFLEVSEFKHMKCNENTGHHKIQYTVGIWNPEMSGLRMVDSRLIYKSHLKTGQMFKIVFLVAILNLPL